MRPLAQIPWPLKPFAASYRIAEFGFNWFITSRPVVGLNRRRSKPDAADWRWETDPLPPAEKVCVFVTYSPDGQIPQRAIDHAALWREQGYEILWVIALRDYSVHPAIPFGHAICRENIGHDFAAWCRALAEIDLGQTKVLATVNDSVFAAPSLVSSISHAEQSDADMIAFTENREYRWHTQSYAVVFKEACIKCQAFKAFWTPRIGTRQHVILTYEVPMANDMRAAGMKVEVLFPMRKLRNPTHFHWPQLAERGFPYVKRSSLPAMYDTWAPLFEKFGFDRQLIDQER